MPIARWVVLSLRAIHGRKGFSFWDSELARGMVWVVELHH